MFLSFFFFLLLFLPFFFFFFGRGGGGGGFVHWRDRVETTGPFSENLRDVDRMACKCSETSRSTL